MESQVSQPSNDKRDKSGNPLLLGCTALALILLCFGAFGAAWVLTRDDDERRAASANVTGEQPDALAAEDSDGGEVAVATVEQEAAEDPQPTATSTPPSVVLPTPPDDAELGATLEYGGRLAFSGALTEPGQIFDITFSSPGGQRMFFDALVGETTDLYWTLLDPNGLELYGDGNMSEIIGDAGPFELPIPGLYTIRVTAWDGQAVGSFRFQLWDVPPAQEFEIAVGEEVAGTLETPGQEALYHFDGTVGQQVLVDVTVGEDVELRWDLVYENGTVIQQDGIMSNLIGDSLPISLAQSGRYTLRVWGLAGAVDAYAFKLWDVPPPQEFEIAIGDEVRPGAPAPGAGTLESPGVRDVYRFSAEPGTELFFDVIAREDVNVRWTLAHENGTLILSDQPLSALIGDSGPIPLDQGGVYVITVSGYYDAVGSYAFALTRP